jgi:hypothetical protein
MEEKDKIEQIKNNEDVVKLTNEDVEKILTHFSELFKTLNGYIIALKKDSTDKKEIIIDLYSVLISITKEYNIEKLNIEELEKVLQIYKSL